MGYHGRGKKLFKNLCKDRDFGEQKFLLEQVISIPLISTRIFNHLKFEELLTCSLVSKSWNRVGRRVLREKRKCCARIVSQVPCRAVVHLNELLENSAQVPFNGLVIKTVPKKLFLDQDGEEHGLHQCVSFNGIHINQEISSRHSEVFKCELDAFSVFFRILSKVELKYLVIDWDERMWVNQYCPAYQLIKKIFSIGYLKLEYLRILSLPLNAMDKSLAGTQLIFHEDKSFHKYGDKCFSRLKTLVLSTKSLDTLLANSDLKKLLGVSPALRSVVQEINNEDMRPLLEKNKVEALSSLRASLNRDEERLRNIQNLLGNLHHQQPLLRVQMTTAEITLTVLELSHAALVLMSCRQPLPLPCVKHLLIDYDPSIDLDTGLFNLAAINFKGLFPNLLRVKLEFACATSADLRGMITNELLQGRRPQYKCGTVLSFEVSTIVLRRANPIVAWFQELTLLFPNVRHYVLTVFPGRNFKQYFEAIWSSGWSNLESVCLRFTGLDNVHLNYDSSILGISPEECEELRLISKTHEQSFKDLQIVPVRASIFNCEKLRKLSFELPPKPFLEAGDGSLLMSELTNLLGCSRLPNFGIEIAVRFQCLRDLRSYRFPLDYLRSFSRVFYQIGNVRMHQDERTKQVLPWKRKLLKALSLT